MAFSGSLFAQKDCVYSVNDTTKDQELKTTMDHLMYEKVFGGSSQFVFFSLSNSQGVPLVNFQLLAKSKDFPKSYCLDGASRIYLQLANNKIVTLISAAEEQCSSLMYDEIEKNNIRTLTGVFLFTKGSLEDLKESTISFIRVKYVGETVDYPMKRELVSETMKKTYKPETYFIDNLKCIEE